MGIRQDRAIPPSIRTSYGWHQILEEDVVQINPLDPGDHMLPQKVLINIGVDLLADANKNDQTFLAIAAHHSQHQLLQRSLGEGRDADSWPTLPTGRSVK